MPVSKPDFKLVKIVKSWGARDVSRVIAGIQTAVREGVAPATALTSLKKNQPALFRE